MLDIGVLIQDEESVYTEEGIRELKRQGINVVGILWKFVISCGGEEILGFREICKNFCRSGIQVYTVTLPKGWGNQSNSIINRNIEQRKKFLEWMKKLIEIAGEAGMKTVPVYTSGACLPYSETWRVDSALDFITQLLPYTENSGVRLAIVNAQYTVEESPDTSVRETYRSDFWSIDSIPRLHDFIAQIHSPNVGICFDTGISNRNGTVLEDMFTIKDSILHFYLNDTATRQEKPVQPGYGTVPWVGLGRIIKEMGYDIPLFVNAAVSSNVDYSKIITETKALLNGNVYTRPDGGRIGKDRDTGRILVKVE